MADKKRFDKDIFEINGKDTFVKIKVNAFPIGKVLMSFVKFDPITKKRLDSIDIYVSFEDMRVFCNDIVSGKIPMQCEESKKQARESGSKYPKEVWMNMGGTDEEKCKTRKLRTDGKAISRVLKFSPGSSQPFIFQAEQGVGESNTKGLIVPRYGTKPDKLIRVPCTPLVLKQFALLTIDFMQSWITYQFISGAYDSTYVTPTAES